MNEQPVTGQPVDSEQRWEMRVQEAAKDYPFPPTPDLSSAVRASLNAPRRHATIRRLAQLAALILLLLAGMMAVPQIRAAVLEVLRIGAVRIFSGEPTQQISATPTRSASVLDLPGETPLDDARARFGLPVRLPTYPADLGEPDRAFLLPGELETLVLVWLAPGASDEARMSLHYLRSSGFIGKFAVGDYEETAVSGRRAVWLPSPHFYEVFDPRGAGASALRYVEDSVLVWDDGQITYRLETDLPPAEAIRVAESLE